MIRCAVRDRSRTLTLPSTVDLNVEDLTLVTQWGCLGNPRITRYINTLRCKNLQLCTSIPPKSLMAITSKVRPNKKVVSFTINIYGGPLYDATERQTDTFREIIKRSFRGTVPIRWICQTPHSHPLKNDSARKTGVWLFTRARDDCQPMERLVPHYHFVDLNPWGKLCRGT